MFFEKMGLPFPQETDELVVMKLLMPLNLFDHLNMCYSYSYVGHLKLSLFWIFTILLNSSLITCALHVHILYSWETALNGAPLTSPSRPSTPMEPNASTADSCHWDQA